MKKLLIVLPLFATILFMNCENNTGTESLEEKHFVTISYHSEGHTGGEPLVDDNKYELVNKSQNADFMAIPLITIQDQGTLKKDGYRFFGWILPNVAFKEPITLDGESVKIAFKDELPEQILFLLPNINQHFELHALWSEQ